MTATPGRPEDWADTNPESTTPERILPTPEGVTPSATKVAMVCYAVGAASKCWEHPERAGVFDSDRASQIVTELCVALGVEQQGDAAPESARPATLTPEQHVKAPGQDGDVCAPQEPVLPRPIKPEDVRVGMVVERRRNGECYVGGRVKRIDESAIVLEVGGLAWVFGGKLGDVGWSLWLIEDAPEPVDPDAEPTDADTEDAVYLSGPMTGLPDFNRPAFHAAAAALREQGYVVINPAEVDLGPDATWSEYMRVHLAEIARRVTQVFVLPGWESSRGAQLEVHVARSLGLTVEDAPAPVDPDAEALDQMAQAMANLDGSDDADEWVPWAEVALDALRETHVVTPRAEQ